MKKRFLSLIIALAMMVGVFTPLIASAADETTESVTLHKMLMNKSNLNAKRVTIKTGEGEKATEETKVIVEKEGKYYYSTDLKTALQDTNEFLKAYKGENLTGKTATVSNVFEGTVGIDGTKYVGTQIDKVENFFGTGSKEIPGVYFAVKYNSGDNNGKFVTIKEEAGKDPVYGAVASLDAELGEGYRLLAGKTGDNGITFKTKGLKGDFSIEEYREKSSYKGENQEQLAATKSVPVKITLPLVNNDGVVKEAHVYPKNTEEKPQIDKNFKKGHGLKETDKYNENGEKIKVGKTVEKDEKGNPKEGTNINDGAQYPNADQEKARATVSVGDKVPYEVKTKILKDSHYKKLVWNDTMTKGLTFNKDLKVAGAGLTADDYTIVATDRGFTLILKESGLTKVENEAKTADVEITLTYSATVNGDAKVDNPEKNNVELNYSNKPGKDSEPKETNPSNQQISVEKTWATDGKDATAPNGVKVVYTLQVKDGDDWKDVTSVTKTGTDFSHTFTGLDDNKIYRVVETVSGYEVEYTKAENGTISIKNNKDSDNPTPLKPTTPEVVTGGKKFVKTNQESTERLAGAQFLVKNANNEYLVAVNKNAKAVTDAKAALDAAVKAYNELSAEDQKGEAGTKAKALINEKQDAYNKAFIANASNYEWTTLEAYKKANPDSKITEVKDIPNIVKLVSDAQGRFEITGLAYGNYKLEEIEAPKDYAKLNDDIQFTVAKGSYDGKNAEGTGAAEDHIQYNKEDLKGNYGLQVINKKVSIPQTGGIGTIIFTAIGLAIMASAIIAIKKRQATEAR